MWKTEPQKEGLQTQSEVGSREMEAETDRQKPRPRLGLDLEAHNRF